MCGNHKPEEILAKLCHSGSEACRGNNPYAALALEFLTIPQGQGRTQIIRSLYPPRHERRTLGPERSGPIESMRPCGWGNSPLPQPGGEGGSSRMRCSFSHAARATRAFRYLACSGFVRSPVNHFCGVYSAGNAMLRSAGARHGYRDCCTGCERDQNDGVCGGYRYRFLTLPQPRV
jgi:hypothetical protein